MEQNSPLAIFVKGQCRSAYLPSFKRGGKMLKVLFPVILFVSVLCAPSVEARIYIDINAPTMVQIPIALAKWKSGDRAAPDVAERAYEIMSNDLTLSGFFKVIEYRRFPPALQARQGIPDQVVIQDWAPTGGEILLTGEILFDADTMNVKVKFHLFDLVDQKHVIGKQYEGHLQTLRNIVHRMADEVVLHLTGDKGVHSTKIAYASVQDPGKEIFIADFDGFGAKAVTQNRSINISPAWCPDNRRIAFTTYMKRNPDLYLVDMDGKNQRRFVSYPGLNASPSWSPDGSQIVLMMGMEGKSDIYVVDANGENPKKLTKGHGNEASPRWSPDGKSIAFVSDRSGSPQIYSMARDGSNVRRLTYEGTYNTSPSWSPKGDRIAFCGRTGGRFNIFTIGVDGSSLQQLTKSGESESPAWSPDGRYIAFSSNRSGVSKIYVMNSNGFNQRALMSSSKGGELSPAWSRRFE
jgi:TolB protein